MEAVGIVRIPVVRVSRVRSVPVITEAVRAVRVSVVRALATAVTVVRGPERVLAWVRASVSVVRVARVLAVRGKILCAPRIVGRTSVRILR